MYGVCTTVAGFALLVIPLVIAILATGLGTSGTIALYAVALPLDALFVLAWLIYAVRCAARASRGELFAVPLVSRVADRVFGRAES